VETRQFKEIFIPLSGKLLRFALRFTGSEEEAEDVVQETLLKLWNMREKMPEIKNKEAMAMTITRNLCLDRIRTKHTVGGREDVMENNHKTTESPEQILHRKEAVKQVYLIMQELPENQRTVMHLRDIEGYEFEEISRVTGITMNNIRVLLSRARKKVKEQLIKQHQYGNERPARTIEEIL